MSALSLRFAWKLDNFGVCANCGRATWRLPNGLCVLCAYLMRSGFKLRSKDGWYYDLIKLPHGHLPAPKVNLWSHLPLPVKEWRDENYYCCPMCGKPSFFKINFACYSCQDDFEYDEKAYEWAQRRAKIAQRRRYFKQIWKRLEYLILPLLVLLGKASYVPSIRRSPEIREIKDF